jgi:hypothetical protein
VHVHRSANCTLERMNKRPGHVVVTTEVAMCSFCGRPRTLRNEQHQLGALVRTIVTCETCHRTLSSSIAVASADSAEPQTIAVEPEPASESKATAPATESTAKPAAKRKPAVAKPTASKSRTHKKTR